MAFFVVVALATAMTVPVVGALLIFSLMIGPPAAACSFTDRPPVAIALSVAIALVTVWIAIAISFVTNWPIGFFVGAFSAASYVQDGAKRPGRTADRFGNRLESAVHDRRRDRRGSVVRARGSRSPPGPAVLSSASLRA